MRENLNIDTYRKKRRRKNFYKYCKYAIIAVLVLSFFALIWNFFINQRMCSQDTSNFPISLSGDSVIDFQRNETGFAVLTNKQLDFYSLSGVKLRTVNNTATLSVINSCGDKTLLYEQGGTGYSLEKGNSTTIKNTIEDKIILGKVAKNGNVALVTEDEKYACRLVIYDSSSNQIFRWNSAENIITDFCFTDSGDGCVVATMGAKDGVTRGTVYGLNFSNNNEMFKTVIGDCMPLAIKFDKGHADIICENKLVVVDDKGSVLKEKSYVDKLLKYVLTQNNYIVMLFSEESKSTAKIVVYDILGEEVSQTELKEKIRTIDSDGRNVVVLTDNSVVCCDMQLKILNTISNKQNVDRIICIDSFVYDISMGCVHKFALQ